jgi:hypothetical protein
MMFAKQWRFLDKRSPRWRYFSDSLKVEESIQMRIPTPIQALSAAAALALLAGCSSGSALAPKPAGLAGHVQHTMGHQGSSVMNPAGMLALAHQAVANHKIVINHNTCPATGVIIYISDATNNMIDVFAGPNITNASTPCFSFNDGGTLAEPQGITVKSGNLYVANTIGNGGTSGNVDAFHRGQATHFKQYNDPSCSGEYPADVTVSADGTVIATDIISNGCSGGQISTWNKSTGALEGNFPAVAGANAFFLTVQKNGTVYYDDNFLQLNSLSCPLGACGAITTVSSGTFAFPGGIRSATGEDVVLDDQSAPGSGLDTFESFPSFANQCSLGASDAVSYDFNKHVHHAFYADAGTDQLGEAKYVEGSNTCTHVAAAAISGQGIGAAVDAPEPLN